MSWPAHWILDEQGHPKPEPDVLKWGAWFEQADNRVVRQDRFTDAEGREIFVSTIFLSLDHSYGSGPPVLWETMAFGTAEEDNPCERYTSLFEATIGHARMVLAYGGQLQIEDEDEPGGPSVTAPTYRNDGRGSTETDAALPEVHVD